MSSLPNRTVRRTVGGEGQLEKLVSRCCRLQGVRAISSGVLARIAFVLKVETLRNLRIRQSEGRMQGHKRGLELSHGPDQKRSNREGYTMRQSSESFLRRERLTPWRIAACRLP